MQFGEKWKIMIAKSMKGSSDCAGKCRYVSYAFAGLLFGLVSIGIRAGTFFVDSAAGNDRNSGATKASAWKTVPGMAGAISWGAISESNKIQPGTTIEIKAGSRFVGKRWTIDKIYYAPGTAAAPTTIRVSGEWGSGNVVIDGRGAAVPKWNGGVQITDMSYIIISGADNIRRLEIKNFSGHSNILHYNGSETSRGVGNQLKWFDCHHSTEYCANNIWQDDLLYEDGLAHHNGALEGEPIPKSGTGVLMGGASDATGDRNVIRRVSAYKNGLGAKANDGSVSFGFQVTGGKDTLFEDCEAYENGRDGFDAGRADNKGDASMKFLNSSSYKNKEDGFGLNAGPIGQVSAIHINSIASYNGQANWTIYDGAKVEIYHAAGRASNANFHAFVSNPGWPSPKIKIRNSYFSAIPGGKQIQYYNASKNGFPIIDSDFNSWIPGISDREIFDDHFNGSYISRPSWMGQHDRIGIKHLEAILNLIGENWRIPKSIKPLRNSGIYLNSPNGVNFDRYGNARANPPDVGPFAARKLVGK
jgi:hypothetical protein